MQTTDCKFYFMSEQEFLAIVKHKAAETGLNPLLFISGIEGLYSFRNVPAHELNFGMLDSLILTIFALRIGDSFDELSRQNLEAKNLQTRMAAERELELLSEEDVAQINDPFLTSFAQVLQHKLPVRRYHRKALEVAAIEIKKAQLHFANNSIGAIVFALCQSELKGHLHLAAIFSR